MCEEFDPSQSSSDKWDLIDFLKSKGVNVSAVRDTDMLYIYTGEKVVVVHFDTQADAEEDAESVDAAYGEYGVNDEVEKLANKANKGLKGLAAKGFGTSAQRAKSAVKKRTKMAGKAVDVYDKKTRKLENDLRNVQ